MNRRKAPIALVLILSIIFLSLFPGGAMKTATAANGWDTRLGKAVAEGEKMIDDLPNPNKSNDIRGYRYRVSLGSEWGLICTLIDTTRLDVSSVYKRITGNGRLAYIFSAAIAMCSRNDPIEWLNPSKLAEDIGYDEYVNNFVQFLSDEKTVKWAKDRAGDLSAEELQTFSDMVDFSKALRTAGLVVDTWNGACETFNTLQLLKNLDKEQMRWLAVALKLSGDKELRKAGEMLEAFKDFSGDAQSYVAYMTVLANFGMDLFLKEMTNVAVDAALKVTTGTVGVIYNAAIVSIDLISHVSSLTSISYDMTYAKEIVGACWKDLQAVKSEYEEKKEQFFTSDDLTVLKDKFSELMYEGINMAEAAASMEEVFLEFYKAAESSYLGKYYIDGMETAATEAQKHIAKYRNQADQLRNQLQLVNRLIDNGGMMPEEIERYEDYKKDWAHHWVMRDYPENYLDISFDHDYSMKVITHFEGMEDSEYELKIYEDMTGTGFFGDPFEGLTGSLWVNDPLEGCLTAEFGYIGEIDRSNPLFPYIIYYENGSRYGSEQYYVIDDNAENSDYYWDGWEEPVYLGPEGVEELFGYLSDKVLLAASGAGAWEGRIKFDKEGGFTAYYYDEDAGDEIIYEVYFTGKFDTSSIQLDGTNGYLLRASEISTQHTPGTEAVTDFGSRIVYEEPLFKVGETLLLTRPGTPDPEIPEMVQSEIGGVFGQWEDFETFITLSRLADGWGFFADETSPFTWDVEPFKTIREVDPSLPVFGDDSNYIIDDDQYFVFEKEGKRFNYTWGPGLFQQRAQIYNNDLAVTAGVLSWAIENPARLDMGNEFNTLDIYDRMYCCYNFNHKGNEKRYMEWNSSNDSAAFSIGRKVMSMGSIDDTTVIIIIGRGTQNLFESWTDLTQQGDGPSKVAGHSVNTNISAFEEAMWQALEDFIAKYPIKTPKVKMLIVGHSLGGAMTNMLGARITHELNQISWLKNKAVKDDIYVYTFGAIRVTKQESNIERGYENIHNIYNRLDSYGPEGNWHYTNVSSPEAKFGHTDLFTRYYEEDLISTKCHDTHNYIDSVINHYVNCGSSESSATNQMPEQKPDYTSSGAQGIFNILSKQKMFSMDSSGNWTSEMRVNSDGSFYGVYYDYDITGLFISSFSGSFSTNVEWCGKTNGYLTVKDFFVKNEPYTNGITADGMEFMYTDGPFQTGERLFFTLPGTHTEDIPEDVRSRIYWYYDPFDNYLSHITLNKIDWGPSWWLYADTDYPDTSDITPIALAETDEAISKEGSLLPFEDSDTYICGNYQYAVLADGTVRITKYTGNDTEIHIPVTIDGYSISQIGARAFFNNENLESVWMDQAPLTVIQYEAFRGCENLRFVQLPKTLKEIQYMAFDYCIGLTEIVFFEQVQIIGRRAFSYCKKLGEVYCPDSLLYIDESAFDQCDKKTIWFHVDPDSHAEHYCALYGYNYRYGISGNFNPNLETVKRTIEETRAKGNYADVWVNRWISKTKPELVLNITHNGDDTLHAALNAGQETLLSFDFIPNDNIPESIDMCSGGEEMSFLDFITMNIDAEEGYALRLEGDIQEFDKPAQTGGLQWEDLLFSASEYMPDPLMYGFEPLWRGPIWDGHWRAQKDGHQADLFIANADNESGYVIRMVMDETNVFDCSEIGFYDPYTMMIDFDQFAGMFVLNDDSISFELNPLSNDLRFAYFDFTMNATFYYAGGYFGQQAGLITPFSDTISIMYTNSPTRRQDVQFSTEMFQRNNEKCYLDIALLSMTLSTAAYNSASDKEDQAGLNIVSAYRSLGILDKDIMLFNYKGNKLNTSGYDERSSSFSIASRDMGGYTLLFIVMRGTSTRIDILRGDINVQDILTDANADSVKIINVRAHEGFHSFASLAATGFDVYLKEHPKVQKALEEKKLKVLITGHSLGAAAANLLGAYINGEFYGDLRIPQRDLYVYTFATPRTFFPDGKVPQTSSSANIFNFLVRSNNSDLVDPVTIVPSDNRHEWQRFGRMAVLTTMKTSGQLLDHHDMQNYIDAIVYKIQHNESIALSIDKLNNQIYTCK